MSNKHKPYWKGYLKLDLVTVGVQLFNAVESQSSIKFRLIHKATGKRINMERVVQGHGPIGEDEVVNGYEVDDSTFILIEPAELAALKLESRKSIELKQFVSEGEISQQYFERSYYVAPMDAFNTEGFAIVRDAMAAARKVAVGQVTIGGREWLVALKALGKGMLMSTMRYQTELREPDEYFRDIPEVKPTKQAVALAAELIKQNTAKFDASQYSDRYQAAIKELIATKMRGKRLNIAHAVGPKALPQLVDTPNVMEALKLSLKKKEHKHVAR